MRIKYLALPLSLALVTASAAQAHDGCPSISTAKTRAIATAAFVAPLSTPVVTTTTTTFNAAGTPIASHAASSLGLSLGVAAAIGIGGYLWWKHEHNKALAAAAACAAANQPAPVDYVLKPPADPTAPMFIDGVVYTPTAPRGAVASIAQASALAVNP